MTITTYHHIVLCRSHQHPILTRIVHVKLYHVTSCHIKYLSLDYHHYNRTNLHLLLHLNPLLHLYLYLPFLPYYYHHRRHHQHHYIDKVL